VTPLGSARLAREGRDLSIVTYGATVWKSLEAAEQMEREDRVSVEVLDLRTLLPLDDAAILATVKKTSKLLIVHEDTRTGGLAGEITARVNEQAFEWLDGPVMRVTAHDVPLPYAPTLEDFVLPQTDDIVKAARWLAVLRRSGCRCVGAASTPTPTHHGFRFNEEFMARLTSSCPRWASPSPRAR
jgi:pyruvate/2-oxoglutarate/acetoin dehydrogenase E1 component